MGFLDFFSGGDKVSDKSISDLITDDAGKPKAAPATPAPADNSQPLQKDPTTPAQKPVFGKKGLEDSVLQYYADQGLIPQKTSAPNTWKGLNSGDLGLDDVTAKYKQISQMNKVSPSNQTVQPISPTSFIKTSEPISQDSILQDAAKKGLIPSQETAPTTWAKLKSGELKLNDVQKNYQNFLNGVTIPPLNGNAEVNKNPPVDAIVDPATIQKQMINQNDSSAFPPYSKQDEIYKEADRAPVLMYDAQGNPSYEDMGSPEANMAVNRSQRALNQAAVSGLTFGGYQPTEKPATQSMKVGTGLMSVMGNLFSGFMGGELVGGALRTIPAFQKIEQGASVLGNTIQELKNVKTVANTAGSAEEAAAAGKALFNAQLKKYGLDALKIGTESAVLGGGVGATKSAIQGNTWKNVLADSLNESAWFTAAGLVAQPVFGFLGNRIGARQTERTASAFKALAETPEAQAIAKQGLNPDYVSKLNTEASPEFTGPVSQADVMAKQALDKINKLNPEIGLPTQLLAHPELMDENLNYTARQVSNKLFGDGGPLKFLSDANPQLKLLIDTGKHAEALDAAQASMTKMLADNPDIKDYSLAPFANNASSLNKVVTQRIINTVDNPEKYPNLQKNVFNYLNEPTAENAELLKGQQVPKQFFAKVSDADKQFFDTRLKPQEIDTIVGDSFKDILGTISGEGSSMLPQGIFGKIKDSSDILRTALTFNKELNRRFIQAYAQNPYDMQSYFLKANPDLAPGIQSQINLTRLNKEAQVAMDTRRELSQAMGDIQTKMNAAADPQSKADLQFQMQTLKDKMQSINQVLTNHNGDINTIQNQLRGYQPEQMNEIQNFVNQVYVPQRGGNSFANELQARMQANVERKAAARAQGLPEPTDGDLGKVGSEVAQSAVDLENKYYPKIENAAKWQSRFGAKDNPYYLAADSELADIMNAFQVSGRDISPNRNKMIGGPFGVNIDNPRRAMQRELGPNNVMEKFFNYATDAQATVENQAKKYLAQIDDLGIKQGSVESAWVQKLGEKRALPTDPDFLALKPTQQQLILDAVPKARVYYDDLIDVMNMKMKQLNLPQINKRDDFFTHFGAVTSELPKLMDRMVSGDIPDNAISYLPGQNGQGRMAYWNNSDANFDPNRTVFRSEKKRSGGEFIDDAIGGMQYYLKPALERIHYADLIRQIDVAKQFAPENLGNFLQDFKTKYLLNFEHPIDENAADWWKQGSSFLSKNMQKGAILGNVDILLKHLQSIGSNLAMGSHGLVATGQLFSDEGAQILSQSKNLALRSAANIDVDRTADLIKQQASKPVQALKDVGGFVSDFLEHATDTFFKTAAKHSFLTGYSRAQQAGLNPEQAAQFADKWTEMTQGLHTPIGKPEFYQVQSAKLLSQFSSFSTNLAATLLNDMPTIARTEGAPEAVGMLMKGVAGLMIANEASRKAGMPAAMKMDEVIPFLNNYRFGIGGPLGSLAAAWQAAMGYATDNPQEQRKGTSQLMRTVVSASGIPGAAQAAKMYDVNERKTGESILDIPGIKQAGGFLGLKKQPKTYEYTGKNADQYDRDLIFGHQSKEDLKPPVNRKSWGYQSQKFFRKLVNDNL